jgi:arylsulfatase A-like enzyme
MIIFGVFKIKNTNRTKSFNVFSVIFIFLFSIFLYQDLFSKDSPIQKAFNIKIDPYNQKENYQTNGILLSFIRGFKGLEGDEPDNYASKEIKKIIRDIPTTSAKELSDSEKPNIIIIQAEAFWDPTVVENVEFNKDPLPFFHQLSESSISGSINVPVYGGSTVNTEFEVLTGMTNQFLPAGSIPFKNFINDPLPALPNILGNQGYQSTAIHPYHNWFYQRDSVYKNLGFDNFLSLEFFPEPVQDMMYYRDDEIIDEIIKRLDNSDQPNFIYAVTMQNHGPYRADAKKFYASMEANLKDKGHNFSSEAKAMLEFQADNLVEMDKQLETLIKHLEKSERKTIVAYFGDHLPLLGDNYLVYKEIDYFQNDQTFEDYQKMYSTPLLIWNNFDDRSEKLHISAPFLGPYLLELAGLKVYYLTDYLNELNAEGKSYLPRLNYVEHATLDEDEIETYKELQYDILFGKQYGLEETQVDIDPSKKYRLGYGDPHINTASLTTYTNGDKAILLKGEYFTTGCQVYINGEPVNSTYKNDKTLYAFIPEGTTPRDVQMKIFDSQNKLLAASNKIEKIKK